MQKNWKKIILIKFLAKKLWKIDLYCVSLQAYHTNNNEKAMKSTILSILLSLTCFSAYSQSDGPFKGYIYNKEYKVSMRINLYDNDIKIPGQEIFGEIGGFLRSDDDSRCWIITSAEVNEKKHTANLEIINDYGSEDLTATLSYNPKDSIYTLKQNAGSTIKIARNRKWVKLPGTMQFKRK